MKKDQQGEPAKSAESEASDTGTAPSKPVMKGKQEEGITEKFESAKLTKVLGKKPKATLDIPEDGRDADDSTDSDGDSRENMQELLSAGGVKPYSRSQAGVEEEKESSGGCWTFREILFDLFVCVC